LVSVMMGLFRQFGQEMALNLLKLGAQLHLWGRRDELDGWGGACRRARGQNVQAPLTPGPWPRPRRGGGLASWPDRPQIPRW
jgi:hypothetical protein